MVRGPKKYPDYLVDDDLKDYLAVFSGGRIGAVAIVEEICAAHNEVRAWLLSEEPNVKEPTFNGQHHVDQLLQRAKRLSGSHAGKRAEQLVQVLEHKIDAKQSVDYGNSPRGGHNDKAKADGARAGKRGGAPRAAE